MNGSRHWDGVGEAVRRSMRANRSKDTKPEVKLRSLLWAAGYRYRLHRRDLPGNPDIVFPGRRKAVFVHGCFWHQHEGCRRANVPKSRREYWLPKLARNRERDAAARRALAEAGWDVFVVWECALKAPDDVLRELREFLKSSFPAVDGGPAMPDHPRRSARGGRTWMARFNRA